MIEIVIEILQKEILIKIEQVEVNINSEEKSLNEFLIGSANLK
jgi:hypothetical protein